MDFAFEGTAREVDLCVVADVKPKVDALVDGEAGHQSVLVVYVSAEGADTIGGKDVILVVIHMGIRKKDALGERPCFLL